MRDRSRDRQGAFITRCLALLLAFWIPAAAQAPMLNLVVVEGEGQINNIRQRTAREPVVQVQDENHRPVAGAIVTFTLPSNGAGGTFANGARTLTVTTNDQGQAVARGFQPNSARGQFQMRVNASHNGQTGSTNITMTNAVLTATGAIAGAGHGKLIAVLTVVGAAAAGGIAYGVTQSGGGTTPTPPVTLTTINASTGTVGPPR